MFHRIPHDNVAAEAVRNKHYFLEVQVVNHQSEVIHEVLHGNVFMQPAGRETLTTGVVSDEPGAFGQRAEPRTKSIDDTMHPVDSGGCQEDCRTLPCVAVGKVISVDRSNVLNRRQLHRGRDYTIPEPQFP
jgi:hypothetical protein